MRREIEIPQLPVARINIILDFAKLGASFRTAAHYFGSSKQVRDLMDKPKGRPKTSEIWFYKVDNTTQTNLLVNLYKKRWTFEHAQFHGVTAEALAAVYKSYLEVTQEKDRMSMDSAHNIFSRIRDGSLLSVRCKTCNYDYVKLDTRHSEECPFCIQAH
jgi:hypothetical protein